LPVTLSILPDTFAICRLDPRVSIPSWVTASSFFSITRTDDELSLVCSQAALPNGIQCERDWRGLKIAGPLDFVLTGVIASLATPLANANIPIFAISTFDTDYLLVKETELGKTINVLRQAGHQIL
jgi:hypothetical protein